MSAPTVPTPEEQPSKRGANATPSQKFRWSGGTSFWFQSPQIPGIGQQGMHALHEIIEQRVQAALKHQETPPGPTGFLGGDALANALGVHPTRRNAFLRELTRKRSKLPDDSYEEVQNPKPNSARFLYKLETDELKKLAARYKDPKLA